MGPHQRNPLVITGPFCAHLKLKNVESKDNERKTGGPFADMPDHQDREQADKRLEGKTGKVREYQLEETGSPLMVREPVVPYGKARMTVSEYLEWESGQMEKHEYYQGEVFAMSGPRATHVVISHNLNYSLRKRLDGSSCRPYMSDLRIHIPSNTLFTYPDLSVFCGYPETLDNDDWNALNPIVLGEVLSPSTSAYDRGPKFRLYQDIPSLREYLLVDSQSIDIVVWRKGEDGKWESQSYHSPDDSVPIAALGLEVPVREIYESTKLVR